MREGDSLDIGRVGVGNWTTLQTRNASPPPHFPATRVDISRVHAVFAPAIPNGEMACWLH